LQWFIDGKLLRYTCGVLLCSAIHSVSLMLLLPLVFYFIKFSFKQTVCVVLIGFSLGFVLTMLDVGTILHNSFSMAYTGESSISVVAFGERVLTYIFVAYAYYIYVDGYEPEYSNPLFKIFKIYSMGMLFYGLLLWSPIISSRAIYIFKTLEISLLSVCLIKCKKARFLMLLYFIMLSSVLYVKNISSYISQGIYQNVSIVNYPYVSVFDRDAIVEYRGDTGKYIDWLELDVDEDYKWELKARYKELEEALNPLEESAENTELSVG